MRVDHGSRCDSHPPHYVEAGAVCKAVSLVGPIHEKVPGVSPIAFTLLWSESFEFMQAKSAKGLCPG